MPPRKKARKDRALASDVDGDAAAGASPADRPPRRNLRGRRGGLKDMPNMPLDILIEVFTCMHPRDLLNLARTSKTFRAFLTSRNSAPFWKAAREQVEGLPDCPPFLSEPQYANLLFFPYCHSCLKPNVKNIIWEVYARYCPGCRDKLFQKRAYDAMAFNKLVRLETRVQHFAVNTALIPRSKGSYHDTPAVYLPHFKEAMAKWKALMNDAEKVQFAQGHVAARKQRILPIEALKAWKAAESNNRIDELESIRKARFESIVARLRQEGWADELDQMTTHCLNQLKDHKAVRKPQKLSDTIWQSIRQDVITHMEGVRAARLDKERFKEFSKRLVYLSHVAAAYEASLGRRTPMTEFQACSLDLAKLPPFQQLVDAPSSPEITQANFERLQDMIPTVKAAWLADREQEFSKKALEVLPHGKDSSPPNLSLAILTFKCDSCHREDLKWPNVLAHECARDVVYRQDSWGQAIVELCVWQGKRPPWTATDDTFSANIDIAGARSVVTACGFDPDVATHEDMDKCEARLVCMACPPNTEVNNKETFDWTGAIAHGRPSEGTFGSVRRCRGVPGESTWKLLDAALTARVREVERNDPTHLYVPPMFYDKKKCCAHCEFHCHDSRAIAVHCRDRHSISGPYQLGLDYYDHPDSRPPVRSITLYPENLKRGASRAATAVEYGYGLYAPSIFQ